MNVIEKEELMLNKEKYISPILQASGYGFQLASCIAYAKLKRRQGLSYDCRLRLGPVNAESLSYLLERFHMDLLCCSRMRAPPWMKLKLTVRWQSVHQTTIMETLELMEWTKQTSPTIVMQCARGKLMGMVTRNQTSLRLSGRYCCARYSASAGDSAGIYIAKTVSGKMIYMDKRIILTEDKRHCDCGNKT